MVNLEALREALAPIGDVGIIEETFDFEATPITLRPLRPQQETEVQRWAGQVMADVENEDQATGIEYLDRFKIGCLSYSIVAIGDLDLRDTDVIPTGKTLPNGTEVKVPKHKGLRDLLSNWTRPVIDTCFRKFGEMMEKAEMQVEKSVKFDPVDLDTEMARLQDRMDRLEELKKRRAKGDATSSMSTAMVEAVTATKQVDEDEAFEGLEATAQDSTGPRRSILPTSATPVARTTDSADGSQAPATQQAADPEIQVGPSSDDLKAETQEPAPQDQAPTSPDDVVVSATGTIAEPLQNEGWVDSSDSDAMAEAVAAENARLQKMRSRRAPHRNIAQDDIPVMDPAPPTPEAAPQEVKKSTSTRNPKFVPPGKR